DIHKTLTDMVRERQIKLLSERVGSEKLPIKKNHKRKRDLLDQIIADINRGALTDDMFTELFAEFYGFNKITPEARRMMNGYVDRLELLSNYPEFYNRVANDFWNDLKKSGISEFTASSIFLDLLYHGILSGFTPFARTQKGSLITSSASMVMTTLATPKAAPRAWAEFFKGMPEGAKTAWDIMKTGFSAEEFMDFKPSGDSYIALKVKTPFTELMKNNDYAGTFTKMMFTMPHYMIRTYRAWDALLKAGNKRFHGYMIEYNK